MHTDVSVVSYLYLVKRLSDTSACADDKDEAPTTDGCNNTELSTPTRQHAASRKIFSKYKLSTHESEATSRAQLSDFVNGVDLLCLSKGCVHWRIENFAVLAHSVRALKRAISATDAALFVWVNSHQYVCPFIKTV